jgi:hypothetical protein
VPIFRRGYPAGGQSKNSPLAALFSQLFSDPANPRYFLEVDIFQRADLESLASGLRVTFRVREQFETRTDRQRHG